MVPFKEKVLKYGTPKLSLRGKHPKAKAGRRAVSGDRACRFSDLGFGLGGLGANMGGPKFRLSSFVWEVILCMV